MHHLEFSLDHTAQLGDFTEFHLVVLSSFAKANSLMYINVYPTDKSQTYHLYPTCFRQCYAAELIWKGLGKLQKNMNKMSSIYAKARGEWADANSGSTGNVHVEIHVPLRGPGDYFKSFLRMWWWHQWLQFQHGDSGECAWQDLRATM